jgi:hypothetical protein
MNNQLDFFEHLGETLRPEKVNALPQFPKIKKFDLFEPLESIASDSTKPYPEFLTAICQEQHKKDLRQENVRESHNAIQPHLSRLHSIILSALNNLGGEATKDEIAAFTCLKSEQVHKRMSELEKLNKVEPYGKRKGDAGVNITIWKTK